MEERADRGKHRVPGLTMGTRPNGNTRYRLRWRRGGGQAALVFEAPDLRAARARARALLEAVEAGADPRPTARRRGPLTVRQAVAAWVWANRRRWRRRTLKEYLGLLHRRVLKDLGERPVRSIQRSEVRRLLAALAAKHPVEANRLFATLRALWRWLVAVDQEHLGVTSDPTAGLSRPGGEEKPRDVVLSDDELRRVLASDDFLAFIAHTGTREHETRLLTWDQVDFARAEWRVPSTSAKAGEARVVPLTEGAMGILKRLRATFAERPWVKTRDQKGYSKLRVRPHDIRRTVCDRIKNEYGPAMMHAVAGHTEARLTQIYGPTPPTKLVRLALEWWDGELARIRKTKPEASAKDGDK